MKKKILNQFDRLVDKDNANYFNDSCERDFYKRKTILRMKLKNLIRTRRTRQEEQEKCLI